MGDQNAAEQKKITDNKTSFGQKLQFRWLLPDKIIRTFKSKLNNISEKQKIQPPRPPQNTKPRKTLGLNIYTHTHTPFLCPLVLQLENWVSFFFSCELNALYIYLGVNSVHVFLNGA